jgi:hypothetical protein
LARATSPSFLCFFARSPNAFRSAVDLDAVFEPLLLAAMLDFTEAHHFGVQSCAAGVAVR